MGYSETIVYDLSPSVLQSSVLTSSYIFAFDNTNQPFTASNVYQDVVFSALGQSNNWNLSGANFVPSQSGIYVATLILAVQKTGASIATVNCQALINNSVIPGTIGSVDIVTNGDVYEINKTFAFSIASGQTFKIQVATDNTSAFLQGKGGSPTAVIVVKRI